MRLNVYLISHPIIQKLSTEIKNYISKETIKYHYHILHLLNILLIYEVVRKCVKTLNVYIPDIHSIKEMCIFEAGESYLILTNLMRYGNILLDIHHMLPKVNIQHINLEQTSKSNLLTNNYVLNNQLLNNDIKIIIMDTFLTMPVIELLDHLIVDKQIHISQIKIICFVCSNNTLEQIGEKYPLINIYTTNIYTS